MSGTEAYGPFREAVRTLHPGYFALVMATGIVSIGTHADHQDTLSAVLLWVTGLSYAVLVIVHAWRLVSFRTELAADFTDPARGFGFFTLVAGSDVLGARLAIDSPAPCCRPGPSALSSESSRTMTFVQDRWPAAPASSAA